MSNKNKLRNLEKKRIELIQAIQLCDYNKNKTIRFVQDIKKQYSRGLLTYEKYYSELNKVLKQRTPEQWIKYYDDYADYYKQELAICEKEINKKRNGISLAPLLITFFVLALLGFGLFFLRPTITGFAISEPNITIQESREISKEMIMRTYSTEQIIAENKGVITEYFYPKFPIFNGTDYLTWEEGVDYEKTQEGIVVKTKDGLDCSAKWKLMDEEIISKDSEEISVPRDKTQKLSKSLKHGKLKDLKIYYTQEVNETTEECTEITNETCIEEECVAEQICSNITATKNIEISLDLSKYSNDLTRGALDSIDTSSLPEEASKLRVEYSYIDPAKDIPLTIKDTSISRNRLDLSKGILSELQCTLNGQPVAPISTELKDTYKIAGYFIDLDPSFYDNDSAEWVLGIFENTTTANGDIVLLNQPTNPTYQGSYTSSAGPGSIDVAWSIYVAQHQRTGDTLAYVTSYIDDYLTIINVTNPLNPQNISAGYTNAAPPNSIDGPQSVYVAQHEITGDVLAYVGGYVDDSLTILNVTNPASLSVVGSHNSSVAPSLDGVTKVYARQHANGNVYLYTASAIDDNFVVWNITNPSWIGSAGINGSFTNAAGAGSIDIIQGFDIASHPNGDLYAYGSSYADDYFSMLNISNPLANPTAVAGGSITNTAIDGAMAPFYAQHSNGDSYAYVPGNLSGRLAIINVTIATAPVVLANPFNISLGTQAGGAAWVDVKKINGDTYAYVANSQESTLVIVNVTIPTNPSMITYYQNTAGAGSIDHIVAHYTLGNYTYLTSTEDDYLTILNINPYALIGNYTSKIFDATASVDWETVAWSEIEEPNTDLQLAFRSCNDAACDTETWSSFEDTSPSSLAGINNNQYFQYTVNFTTTNDFNTPFLSWVNISYALAANQAPSNPSDVLLNSTVITQMNYTNESLSASFLCSDPDTSDVLTYLLEWWKNGLNQTALFEAGSCSDPEYKSTELYYLNITKNDIWAFNVTVCDDESACSSQIGSNSLAINNYPASIPELNAPDNNTMMSNVFAIELNWSNVSQLDIDGDVYTYYLEVWNESGITNIMYENTSISETLNTTGSLVVFPSEDADYFWRVLSTDGTVNSSWSELRNISFSVPPANTAPSNPTGVLLNSTTAAQINYTDEDLSANFLCDDPDTSDTLTYDIHWYNEGVYNFSELSVSCGAEPVYLAHVLKNENTTKGENWSFSVNVTDAGSLSSNTVFSNNLTIVNSNLTIVFVSLNDTIAPLDGNIRRFEFSFIANDTDGLADLTDNTAIANVSLSTENYLNTSCSAIGNLALGRNYSCTIEMQYYWGSGSWNYAAEIKDNDGIAVQNSTLNGESQTWYYSQLTATNLTASALTWNTLIPGTANQTSTTNPISIENTGNKPTLNIIAQAVDLAGTGGRYIPAANFTIGNITSAAKIECDSLNQTATAVPGVAPLTFINATNIYPLTNALARGQGSSENLYYCLFDVPANLISEAYSTGTGTEWSINIE